MARIDSEASDLELLTRSLFAANDNLHFHGTTRAALTLSLEEMHRMFPTGACNPKTVGSDAGLRGALVTDRLQMPFGLYSSIYSLLVEYAVGLS